ncbi:MAG: glycosyltransferase [Pegethrix bostrychoides GSE-TBD4-15B]|uniref:Glycosyltransferase n=1 Tax=Pegethrix bostrychoides GSE-TBD4-15B TaxID=2839662 RepID=A0A951PAH9_9CYAN|nr:glycosyltransferase [Pegethrix bostrychoides GSE-TBD4-15B]
MRKLYFLLPGTTGKFACGGLWAELKTLKLTQQLCEAEVVTYRQREPEHLFLADLLADLLALPQPDQSVFVVSWGFDVAKLVPQLRSKNVLYHAHSAGYRLKLPADIPIVTVSRNTLGYWGQQAPHSPIYYLPNQISDEFYNQQQPREIDVLVQARKSSTYLMQQLVPALQTRCKVTVVNRYVEDLPGLFNRAKVYLYDSAEYWAMQSVSEGFGLQPLEAMACGVRVFSSVNGGLSDYLDPGFNCDKIAVYSQAYDLQRILAALNHPDPAPVIDLSEYRTAPILERLQVILSEVNSFFDHKAQQPADIAPLDPLRLTQLRGQKLWRKVQKRYLSRS